MPRRRRTAANYGITDEMLVGAKSLGIALPPGSYDLAKRSDAPGSLICRFVVPGRPIPWKSHKGSGRGSYSDPALASWQANVEWEAKLAMGTRPPYDGPVRVDARFVLKDIPGRRLPDRDNLLKGTNDAMQGIVFVNDIQVVAGEGSRDPGDFERAEISVFISN